MTRAVEITRRESAEQQAALMLLKTRDLPVKQRTMLINAMLSGELHRRQPV